MEVKELEKVEAPHLEQENSEVTDASRVLGDSCGKNDLNLDSVIDVSGKRFEFPLLSGRENVVEEVYLYKNELNLLPRAVGRLKGLKTLKFFANEMNLFPGEFKNLVELEYLQVKVSLPGLSGLELSKLGKLRELELSRVPTRQSAFPVLREISGLKCLTRLSVCHFAIRYLPPEIGYLDKLEYLDLSFNKMRNLPDEIASLNLLKSLKVTNNKLIELPMGLSYLCRLENLDLSNNRLMSTAHLELESMHNLKYLNLQRNQIYGCQIPSWICCNLDGNRRDLSNDESAEMDVYEGACNIPSSHIGGSSSTNRCLAARRAKGWKRRHNLQTKARQERLNNCKKWKVDAAIRSSSEKCTMCKVSSVDRDDLLSEGLCVVPHAEVDNKDIFPEGKMNGASHIVPGNDDFSKDSVDGCVCAVVDSDGMHKEVDHDGLVSDSILDSISDAALVVGECSSSEASNCVLKSKRHYEKDIDNPKPTKSRRPTSDPSLSCQYNETSFCGVGDYLPDGFYDAGRDQPFMPLNYYEENLHINSREVILLDREQDEELDATVLCARQLISHFNQMKHIFGEDRVDAVDDFQIAYLLALFVSDQFGGSDKNSLVQRARKAVSGSNYTKPFICTCETGMSSTCHDASKRVVDAVGGIAFHDICERSLHYIKEKRQSKIVPIGDVQFGVCRHRALLLKYLCDRMEPRIPCELVRGYLDFSLHAWNVFLIRRGQLLVRMIVDACHPHDIREESDPEYFCRYVPLSRVHMPLMVDQNGSPNCSFPSVSICDESGKSTSTTLQRSKFGTLETAVKVRAIETSGTIANDIRNFELCCLGEVRMLSVLKHACIVEFYGHQISSKWSVTEDGKSRSRTLQSAILMEYVKGGSLKNYLEKLSSSGEKHVAVDLALSIARDVAFGLTDLHSKHIIHRDIKSENILIDLEKKRQDGTPTVKICDLDRAIPLHSHLHTCCIAHAGIHPPNICVGTPRWMAPEVFRTMHEQNTYGLEADIWSFGCLLLELLTLQVPYFEVLESEIHESLQMGVRPSLTEELERLIQSDKDLENGSETLSFLTKLFHQCTEKNPTDRPPAKTIYNSLLAHGNAASDLRSSKQE